MSDKGTFTYPSNRLPESSPVSEKVMDLEPVEQPLTRALYPAYGCTMAAPEAAKELYQTEKRFETIPADLGPKINQPLICGPQSEQILQKWLLQSAESTDSFLDIGAGHGFYTLLMPYFRPS